MSKKIIEKSKQKATCIASVNLLTFLSIFITNKYANRNGFMNRTQKIMNLKIAQLHRLGKR